MSEHSKPEVTSGCRTGAAAEWAPVGTSNFGQNTVTFWMCFSLYFSHWVGIKVGIALFAIFLCFALASAVRRGAVRKESVYLAIGVVLYCLLTLVAQGFSIGEIAEWSPNKTPRLLFQAISLFVIIAFVGLLRPLPEMKLNEFILRSYQLFALTILVEWVLVNLFAVPNSMMPGYRDSIFYASQFEATYRPFGLTGNASVNGSLLVIALWILVSLGKIKSVHRYILATGLILILNNSGQALLVYLASVIFYYIKVTHGLARYAVAAALIGIAATAVFSGIFTKISYDYIMSVLRFVGIENIILMDATSQIVGGYGAYSWIYEDVRLTTEFYPIYAISRFGYLLFGLTWLYIILRLPRNNRTLIALALFLGSIHYPTILFVETQVVLAAYLLWTPRKIEKLDFATSQKDH